MWKKTIDISQKRCYYKGELREMNLVPIKYYRRLNYETSN